MGKDKKNSSSTFKDYNEYTSIREERAGAILAFRAGESYDFYGQDVDEVLNCNKNLNKKAATLKFPDGSSVQRVRISKEDVYSNLEALLDRNNGTSGLVFLDKPNKASRKEEVSITSPYDMHDNLTRQFNGLVLLTRTGQFETFGTHAEEVNNALGVAGKEEEGEGINVARHNILEISKLYGLGEVSTFDYSNYLREEVSREIRLGSQTVRNAKAKAKNEAQQPTVYERQAEMLSAAFTKVAESGGYWLNHNHKKYPEVFFSSGQGASTPTPYQALMMCLHSDSINSTTNSYTTYLAARHADNPIVSGEHGVPMLFPTILRYADKENGGNEISRDDYQKLQPEEKNKYRAVYDRRSLTLFNIEQTSDLFTAKELALSEEPEIRPYEKFTEEEKTSLMIHFNDFLLKMRDNLVAVNMNLDGATAYSRAKDAVDILDWAVAKDNIRNGENDYPYYMQHVIRQIVEATGNETRLDRAESLQKNGGLSDEGVDKNGQLIVELASAIKMMEFGLPAELSPWSRLKDMDYWKQELKDNPQLLETIESEVNRSLGMIKKAEMGEKIELRERAAQTRDDADSYCIASQLREHPSLKDEEMSNVICVIDRKEKTADVIVPDHVDLPDTNKVVEFDHFRKEASKFLSAQGIAEIKYYKPSGESFYGPNDSSFKGKEIHAVSFGDGNVMEDSILDASSLKARAMDRHLNRTDMLQDVNGNWTFMIDSQYNFDVEVLEEPVYVHPEKGDLKRYFSTMKNVPDKLPELRGTLAQKYQSAVMKDPNLNINPFELKDESLDAARIKKAFIYKNKEGDIMCRPQIEGVDNVEERKMSIGQWKLLWLSDDMEKTKRNIAAVLYADILKQEITKEQTQEVKEEKQKEQQENKEQAQEVKEEPQVAEDVDDKVFESVAYEGQEYQCRVVKDADGKSLLVAPNQLLDKLKPYPTDYNGLGGFVSNEAKAVDKRIFYYTDKDSLQNLNNEELVAMLAKENPEILQKRETVSETENQTESMESNGLENTERVTNGETEEEEEPYLWIEVSYYGEGSETSHELDEVLKKEEDFSLEDYDYSYGEFPDGALEHAGYRTNGDTWHASDEDYCLDSFNYGGYLLSRKAFLSEIKGVLEHAGGLPQNASEDAKDFVRRYCPQYSGEKNINKENGEAVEQKVEQKKELEDPPMLRHYYELKQKHPDALLLFRVGDSYEAYQDDAKTASELLGITFTRREGKNGGSIQMTGFPCRELDTYLYKLIRAGQRVAICDSLPTEKIAPSKTADKNLDKQENIESRKKAAGEEVKPDKDYIVKARYDLRENGGDWHEEAAKDIRATAERLHKDLNLGFDKLDDVDIRVRKSPVPDAYNADMFLCKSGKDVGLVSLHFDFATKKENGDPHVELSNGDVRIKVQGEGGVKRGTLDFEHNMPYDEFLDMVRGRISELRKQADDYIVKAQYDLRKNPDGWYEEARKDVRATAERLCKDLDLGFDKPVASDINVHMHDAQDSCEARLALRKSGILSALVNLTLDFATIRAGKNPHVELHNGNVSISTGNGGGVQKKSLNIYERMPYDELLDMVRDGIRELRKTTEKKVELNKDGIVKPRYDMGIDSKSLAKALKKDMTATVEKLSGDLGLNRLPGFNAYVGVFERGAIFEKDKLECSAVFPIDSTNIMRVLLNFDTFGKEQNDSHVEMAGGSINIVSGGACEGDRISIPKDISYDELLNMARGKIEEFRAEQSRAEESERANGLNAKETVEEAETESRQHSMRR